jgi:hypothetical protein
MMAVHDAYGDLQHPLTQAAVRACRELFEKNLSELVDRKVKELLPTMLEATLDRVLAKQRKDVGDELVRILLEKAMAK